MAHDNPKPINEIALLTKSIEFVIRRLVRLLIGKITLVRLQELIESSFIEEAETHLRRERPGRDVPLTSLALITGLDTRQLAKIRNSENYRKPKHQESDFLNSMTAESCIVDFWTSDPMFINPQTGEPQVLTIWGPDNSFETVVRQAIRARGITVTSALERMKQSGRVKVHEDESVELISRDLAPMSVRPYIARVKLGLDAVGHLLGTVHRNLNADDTGESRLYQQGRWTHRLSPKNRSVLEGEIRSLLERADKESITVLQKYEEETVDEFQLSAGVGFYFFESQAF